MTGNNIQPIPERIDYIEINGDTILDSDINYLKSVSGIRSVRKLDDRTVLIITDRVFERDSEEFKILHETLATNLVSPANINFGTTGDRRKLCVSGFIEDVNVSVEILIQSVINEKDIEKAAIYLQYLDGLRNIKILETGLEAILGSLDKSKSYPTYDDGKKMVEALLNSPNRTILFAD